MTLKNYSREGGKSSDKMNPAQMGDASTTKYPNRFWIPSETDIKKEIGKLLRKSKDTISATWQTNSRDSVQDVFILDRNSDNIIVNWQSVLEELVSKKVLEKPEVM